MVIALITGAAAGLTGAVPWSDTWVLLPCFALVTASVALAGTAIQHFARALGALLIALFFSTPGIEDAEADSAVVLAPVGPPP